MQNLYQSNVTSFRILNLNRSGRSTESGTVDFLFILTGQFSKCLQHELSGALRQIIDIGVAEFLGLNWRKH